MLNSGQQEQRSYRENMEISDMEELNKRRIEYFLRQIYIMQRYAPGCIETRRPNMLYCNHDGIILKIKTTKNKRVYKSPYSRGIYLWDGLPVDIQTRVDKAEFRRNIRK